MVILDTTLSLLTESLRGWQMDATLLVPGIDRWVDLRVIGGYASFESPTVGSLEYDSWRLGVDFRPVPAVVLSAMWHENERLFGDQWVSWVVGGGGGGAVCDAEPWGWEGWVLAASEACVSAEAAAFGGAFD
jgi:hypothetical protein